KGLSHVIHGFADWYSGREAEANQSAHYFPAALYATSRLFDQLNADGGQLHAFVKQTGAALHSVTADRAKLTDLVTNARTTARALGTNEQALSQSLVNLPPALRKGTAAFSALRPALGDLDQLVRASGPASRELEPFFKTLRPVIAR